MFLSYSYLYTTSILHPSYLLNPTNLSNLSTQPYLNLCPFLLKNYPRYVPLYAYRGFESSGQIYFHFMKSSILKTFTTSLSRYQHNTLHMARPYVFNYNNRTFSTYRFGRYSPPFLPVR